MDISNKVCLITGASGGIGLVTALEIARQGLQVVIVSRDEQRCATASAEIRAKTGNQAVDFLVADLSSQAQVRDLAQRFHQKYHRLDILINNAGGIFIKRKETVDGIELTWALNHLSYFLLTHLLLDTLKASAPARIINVSSNAHTGGGINFDDLEGKRFYFGWLAYAQSKLANILFTFELARRLESSGVTANVLHPGFVATNFGYNNRGLVGALIRLSYRFGISPEEGARTSIYLATSPEVEGVSGSYFVKENAARAAKRAYDESIAKRLWQVSEEMTGVVNT
jgi:retinol dehydrogenase 12